MALVGSREVRDNRASPLERTGWSVPDDNDNDENGAAFGKENHVSMDPKCAHSSNATFSIYEHYGCTH